MGDIKLNDLMIIAALAVEKEQDTCSAINLEEAVNT